MFFGDYEFWIILAQISGMKKGFLYLLTAVSSATMMTGCIKNGTDRTISPAMQATVNNTTNFNTIFVKPGTIKPQLNDTSLALVVTGQDQTTGDKIILTVNKFNKKEGSFGIASGDASADYLINENHDLATKGSVTIKEIKADVITGSFLFTTAGGTVVSGGTFTVGRPWEF